MDKLRIWKEELPFEERVSAWDEEAKAAKLVRPLKELGFLPKMTGITEETKKFLRWKSLLWMVKKDRGASIFKSVMKRPFYYLSRLIKSFFKQKPFKENGDFYLYGIDSINDFKALLEREDTFLIVGFSYCHKPFECPSGRFTDQCIHDPNNSVCKQCFIGKAINQLPCKQTEFVIIPTVHHIGREAFRIIEQNPNKKVIFLITACEMTLKMFADYGNMAGITGIGIRLGGRICNTMRAFELSEEGHKPGLTVVMDDTQDEMMKLINLRQKKEKSFI